MMRVLDLKVDGWNPGPLTDTEGMSALEGGRVLFFASLRFDLGEGEGGLFGPTMLANRKNVSFDPWKGRVAGAAVTGEAARNLAAMLERFSRCADGFVNRLLAPYGGRLRPGRASFRPAEIAGRATSWRKDDTRLHVDAFPSSPVRGDRILRLFTNVNPGGRPRTWRIADSFEAVATRFLPTLRLPPWGSAALLHWLGVTRSRRSAYDALMLQLHDRMKGDAEYQAGAPQTTFAFPAGTSWLAFTDQVPHAAMAGQFQLEQTFYLPIDAMIDPSTSPLRILERLKERALV